MVDEETTPTVRVAIGSAAYDRTRAVLEAAREAATDTHIREVGPTGAAGLAPVVMVTADGRTDGHPRTGRARPRP